MTGHTSPDVMGLDSPGGHCLGAAVVAFRHGGLEGNAIEKDSIASTSTTAIEPKADTQIAEIIDAFPRPEMKQRFTRAVCSIVATRPTATYESSRSTDLPEPA